MAKTRKHGRETMTKRHALTMRGVLMWLESQPDANPLEIGVLGEIVERVENHAKHGGVVRTRIKNLGDRPRVRAPNREDTRAWSVDECDQLQRLYVRENKSIPEIAERLERTQAAIRAQLVRLNMRRNRYTYHCKSSWASRTDRGTYEAAKRIRARRLAEGAREGVDHADQ